MAGRGNLFGKKKDIPQPQVPITPQTQKQETPAESTLQLTQQSNPASGDVTPAPLQVTKPSVPKSTVTFGRGRGLLFPKPSTSAQAAEKASTSATAGSSGSSANSSAPVKLSESLSELTKKLQSVRVERAESSVGIQSDAGDDQSEASVVSFPEPVIKRGEVGQKVHCSANYMRLNLEEGKGVFEYIPSFTPEVDSIFVRNKMIYKNLEKIGGVKLTYDGNVLYLPTKLPNDETVFSDELLDGTRVTIKIKYKKQKRLEDCVQLYNILFNKIMNDLALTRFGPHFYNSEGKIPINEHKLEVWPGYVTSVDVFEGGIQLMCDVSHRVLRTETCLDIMNQMIARRREDYRREILNQIVGSSVLTRYNNKVYKITDIAWDATPHSTFLRGGKEVTYVDYYYSQYEIRIADGRQPMLVSEMKSKDAPRKKMNERSSTIFAYLVPELCYMTGITDDMRSNFRLMKSLSTCTIMNPNLRMNCYKTFLKNIKGCDKAMSRLKEYGLSLADETVDLCGRELPTESITFGRNDSVVVKTADWGKDAGTKAVFQAVDLSNWSIVFPGNNWSMVKGFIDTMIACGRQAGIYVSHPHTIGIDQDTTSSYVNAIRRNVNKDNTQIVVVLLPTAVDNKYAAVKKLLCVDLAVPSQVVLSRTLSRKDKFRGIVQKICLQMNCKVGGSLWAIHIPWKSGGTMFIGVDVYHDPKLAGTSSLGFVASMNVECTKWHTKVATHVKHQEIAGSLETMFAICVDKWKRINGDMPIRVIVFRDGVSDGDFDTLQRTEIPQMLKTVNEINAKMLFVVVQKRINTKIFLRQNQNNVINPNPGTVIDSVINRRLYYDFFIVSQKFNQGTINPTHYVVLHDSLGLKVDITQRITYKMCHLYYNWPGTIRVPAPCQYAHKVAMLIGQSVREKPDASLEGKLYFL